MFAGLKVLFRVGAVLVCAALTAVGSETTVSTYTNLANSHWAFQRPNRPALPRVANADSVRNAIDAFILRKLEQQDLSYAPAANRRTLIRRLYLDVLGLPPTPEEVTRFEADKDVAAYEALVDRVLASPHYGERWARHWLDVVRFAETHGFETNTPRDNAWPYRDYIISAFNEDKPYTQFILEQLAGDAFGTDAATGFLVAGPWDEVKSPDVVLTANQRADELHDVVSTVGSAFLGLTVGCARCHDHKFDPVPQTDYYAVKAVFAGVHHGERKLKTADYGARLQRAQTLREKLQEIEAELTVFEPIADPAGKESSRPAVHSRRNVDRFSPIQAKYVRFVVLETTGLDPCIDELEIYSAEGKPRNVALASAGATPSASSVYPDSALHRLEHINDGFYGNSRSWISREAGQGWVQIALPGITLINKVVWGRDREEKYQDRLATRYRIEVATDTNRWTTVATTDDRHPYSAGAKWQPGIDTNALTEAGTLLEERARIERTLSEITKTPMVYAGTFTDAGTTYRLHRGDPMLKKEPVTPAALSLLGEQLELKDETAERDRRLALARWIASEENPLTARVMVNRIWQYHFGRGLVETPSDFGINGSRPSHPELLDWLATEFVAQGGRAKPVHRLILLSSVYQQSSVSNAKAVELDAGNRLLWRSPPRRMEAEVIRDSTLCISGTLDLRMGGPGYHVFEPNNNYVRVYNPKEEFGPAEWRRMIYQYKPRMQQDATFGAFDCPDGGQIAPKRTTSTTPLQALNLFNSGFVLQQSEHFAKRLEKERSPERHIERAFLLAYSRKPSAGEMTASTSFIASHGLVAFCRAILNSNEFLYIY